MSDAQASGGQDTATVPPAVHAAVDAVEALLERVEPVVVRAGSWAVGGLGAFFVYLAVAFAVGPT